MKAAVLYKTKTPLQIEPFDLPVTAPGYVRVVLKSSGVCHSDWHVVKGDWPHIDLPCILGHEGAGIVEEVGTEVTDVKPGDHVILSWKVGCGLCEMCQNGYPNLCDMPFDTYSRPISGKTGEPMNKMIGLGTFGTHTLVPRAAVVPIDRDVPFTLASLVGCAVMTGVGAVINTAKVEPGASVAVFGCGGVGLNCIQGAVLAGADPIIAVDIRQNKLEMARTFGATHTVDSLVEDTVERVKELSGGPGAHYAFEAVGLGGDTFLHSIECTRKRGVTVFVGHAPFETKVAMDARMLIHEKSVIGSYYGTARPHIDFPRIIRLYKAGKLKLDELVSREYPLERVNDAFNALENGEVARSVLVLKE